MANPTNEGAGRPIQARRFLADFSEHTPRHWCGGDPVLTHILNAYTLLVPGNEGYYIRTLKRLMPKLPEPAMRAMVAQFLLQEGQHGVSHRRCWKMLEAQGYRIASFQRPVDAFLYRFLEPITPLTLRVAMVACVEHVNAYLGHEFLEQDLLREADPDQRALFEWHFAEEIEHKHVVFDVLQARAGGYLLRVIAALLVLPLFYLLMTVGTFHLLRQDRLLGRRQTWTLLREHLFSRDHMARRTCRYILDYLRPRFHPWQLDDRALAQRVIDRYSAPEAPLLKPLAQTQAA